MQSSKLVIKRSQRYVPPKRIYGKLSEYWWDITLGGVARMEKDGRVIFEKEDCGEQCVVESQRLLPLLTRARQKSRKAHPWGIRVLADHPNELAIEPGLGGGGGWVYIPVNWYPPIEEDWRRFFTGYPTGSVPETEMVKFKARGDVGCKAGIYYFLLFLLSIRATVNSDELVAVVCDANGDLDQSLSERFLEVVSNNLPEDWTPPNVSVSRKAFSRLRDRALIYMPEVKHQRERTARQRNDALIAIWCAAAEKTFEVKKRSATARPEKATDKRIVRMYQGLLGELESKLQNTRTELEAKKHVSVVYEPVAYGLMELQGK